MARMKHGENMRIHDQHVHSYYSFDCKQPIEEYLIKATALGLSYFVLTDHCDFNFLDKENDLFFDVKKQNEELNDLQIKFPSIKILRGIEIGYKPNQLNRIKDLINNNKFDVINLSLHESDEIDYFMKSEFNRLGIDETLTIYFKRQVEMAKDYDDYDVLCHLDYGFKTAYLIDNNLKIEKYAGYISKIMKEVIKKGKTLELNLKVQEVLPIEHTIYILNLYKSLGGEDLTMSSDAHEVSRFCKGFDYYTEVIKKAGFDHLTYFVNREKYFLPI